MNRSFYKERYFELEKELKEISKEYRFRLFKSDIDELNARQDLFYSDYLKRLSEIKQEIDICKANTKTRYADNIVFMENGKILLLRRRSMDETFPNHWTLPGGHVGENEDCADAAMRELEEEAGIRVDKVIKVGEYDDDKCHIEYFESSVSEDTQLILSDDETEDYKWLTINEINDDSIKMPFNMKENLMKIVNPFEYPIKKIIKAYQDGIISEEVLREALIKATDKKDYGVGKKQEQVVVHNKETGQTFMRKQTVGHKEDEKKDENKKSEKEPEQDLNEVAKNTSESKLQDAIKHHSDPKIRQAAHDELKRRQEEEHPQKEDGEKTEKKDELSEEEIREKLKKIRKISADLSDIDAFYNEEQNKVRQYFKENKSEEDSIGYYIGNGCKNIRRILSESDFKDISKEETDLISDFKKLNESLNEKYADLSFIAKKRKKEENKEYVDLKEKSIDIQNKVKIHEISSFINNNKINNDLVLNRRVRSDGTFFSVLKEGDIYEDKSFSSTSLKELTQFGDFNIKILAKKGSKVANLANFNEMEYLIDKNSQFRVIEKNKDGITVELL